MPPAHLLFNDALVTRCAQVVYRCLEEVGSTKAALYLKPPGGEAFLEVCHFGWPRTLVIPSRLPLTDPLCTRVQRERRSFLENDGALSPELQPFGGASARYFVTPLYLMGDWVGILVQRDRQKGDAYEMERAEAPTLRICQEIVDLLSELGIYGPPRSRTPAPSTTAAEVVRQTPPPVHPAPRVVKDPALLEPGTFPGVTPVVHAPPEPPRPQGERMFGFGNTAAGFSALPWEQGQRTLGSLMAPDPASPTRGLMSPELRAAFWEVGALLSRLLALDAVALWADHPEEIRPILCYSARPIHEDLQQQILGHATYHLEGVREPDLRLVGKVEMEEEQGLTGAFATYLPLMMNEHPGGQDLLLAFRQVDRSFSLSEMEILQRCARILGMHLEESRVHERYHQAFLSVSHRILKSAESRIPHLRDHSIAAARLARELALALDLPGEEVENVSIAAILHDVGMLLLDPAMLKKAQLTAEERVKVRQHPDLAVQFLKDLRFPFDVMRTIRHHHERWDGHGYPDRLQESAIPMGSRILHVIEAFEVMTGGKGYRHPVSPFEALEEVKRGAGSQFDPEVVEAFLGLMARKG